MSVSEKLAQRRKILVIRSAVLRTDLLADSYLMRHAATPARVGAEALDILRTHKMMIAGCLLAVMVIKPRRIMSVVKAAVVGWQALRNVKPLLQNLNGLLTRK